MNKKAAKFKDSAASWTALECAERSRFAQEQSRAENRGAAKERTPFPAREPVKGASQTAAPSALLRLSPTADGGRSNESLCPEIMCFQPPVRCQRGSAGCFRLLGSSPDEDERRRRRRQQQQQESQSAKLSASCARPDPGRRWRPWSGTR